MPGMLQGDLQPVRSGPLSPHCYWQVPPRRFKLRVMLESNSDLGYGYIKLDVLHQLRSECGPLPNTGFGLFFSVELLNYKPKAVVVNEPHILRRKSVVD